MLPEHAPFSPEQKSALSQLIPSFTPQQSAWLSGFLASATSSAAPAAAKGGSAPLTILYGTESGNAEMLADKTVKAAKKKGFKPKMVNMSETEPASLAKVENLLVLVSTWGDGDPPDDAENFCDALRILSELGEERLRGVGFAVFGLGDSHYEQFCRCGKEMDRDLERVGGRRVLERVDCDVDITPSFEKWESEVLGLMRVEAGVK